MALERAAEAARNGDLATLEALSADQLRTAISSLDEDGRSVLHAAAAGGNRLLIQYLLQQGAAQYINTADDEGWTPLHSAASAGHKEAVQILLEAGADVHALTSSNRTALHYAASKNPAAVPLLLAAGAKANAKDTTGSTPLHRACGAGKVEAIKLLLLDQRVRLEDVDGEGSTPLLVATLSAQAPASLYLASVGANLEAANRAGETPLSAASTLSGPFRQTLVAISRGDLDIDDVS